MSHKLVIPLLLMLIFVLPSKASAIFHHLSVRDGLSQLSVLSIYEDKLGRIWLGTEEGLNVYDGMEVRSLKQYGRYFKAGSRISYLIGDGQNSIWFVAGGSLVHYNLLSQRFTCLRNADIHSAYFKDGILYYGQGDKLLATSGDMYKYKVLCRFGGTYIRSMMIDSRNRLWIGTTNGLYLKPRASAIRLMLSGTNVSHIFEDSNHDIWVSTRSDGCWLFRTIGNGQPKSLKIKLDPLEGQYQVRSVTEDNRGIMWIGTSIGLYEYNKKTASFIHYIHSSNSCSLSFNSIYPVYKGSDGTIWVGTYYGGLNYLNPSGDSFTFYPADQSRSDCLSYPFVGHMAEDNCGYIWICTEGGGLNMLNPKTGIIKHFRANANANSLAYDNLKDIVYDQHADKLYIGTHTKGLSIYDLKAKRFKNLFLEHKDYGTRYGDQIYDMKLHNNRLFFTTQNGLWQISTQTLAIMPLFKGKSDYGNNNFFINGDDVWIPRENGLWKVSLTGQRKKFYKLGQKGLGNAIITDIVKSNKQKNTLYLTSLGGGIYRYNQVVDSFVNLNTANSHLLSDFCYEIIRYKNLYVINTDQGISFYNPVTKAFFNFCLPKEFPLEGINRGNGMLWGSDGRLYVAGINGLVSFFPDELMSQQQPQSVYFTRLYVNNREVLPTDSTHILDQALFATKALKLTYTQNDITIRFATRKCMKGYQQTLFEYTLDGYDDEWIENSTGRINFKKLPPGHYCLRVRPKGMVDNVASLKLTISPPFYWSPASWMFYIALLLSLAYAVFRIKRSRLVLENALAMERHEKENIEALNKAKLMFFTTISHELRTPLTLIITDLHTAINERQKGSSIFKTVERVYNNALQLLQLVNQLLDFRKINESGIKLHLTTLDLVSFIRGICANFEHYAQSRHISFHMSCDLPELFCSFDRSQMEKVVYNLLSNAFKYVADDRGDISVYLTRKDNTAVLSVIDNGIGISSSDQKRIFDRYYQAESNIYKIATLSGTGIGLAVAKEIVEKHHGTISVKSVPNYGSSFTVQLPIASLHVSGTKEKYNEQILQNISTEHISHSTSEKSEGETSYKILIVEDNQEMLQTLVHIFSKTCTTITATNGKEGLEKTRNENPDLVLSDIMMPVMNGSEMCRCIKDDIKICHIPVVLLTAIASPEVTLKELENGTDEYITKPFNPDLLVARCNSIVRSRILMRKNLMGDMSADNSIVRINPLDKQFLSHCDEYLRETMGKTDIKVDDMAAALNMGHTAFYQKMKALTGQTPNDYISSYKLRRSADLLRKSHLTIAEIAFSLGYSSPKYFSQSFKAKYGVTPSDYRNSKC